MSYKTNIKYHIEININLIMLYYVNYNYVIIMLYIYKNKYKNLIRNIFWLKIIIRFVKIYISSTTSSIMKYKYIYIQIYL